MRIALMIVCAVLMPIGSIQAAIMGTWSTEDAGDGLDRLVFTVTPTAGETMAGFDIAIYDPSFAGVFRVTTPLFKSTKDQGSSFLLNKNHPGPGNPPTVVTDLLTVIELQDTYVVGGALVKVWSGAYSGGWSGPLQLAEIIVPHGSISNPLTQLVVAKSNFTGPHALASKPDGTVMNIYIGPEPGTVALLASGAIGLLLYGWWKRR